MASVLAQYLRTEIDRRGWDDRDLADRAGLNPNVVSNILKKPKVVPTIKTLSRLAQALNPDNPGTEMDRLIRALGFPTAEQKDRTLYDQVALLAEQDQELRKVLKRLPELEPAQKRRLDGFLEGMIKPD